MLAHAGHWLVNALYLAPVVLFLAWLAVVHVRERRERGAATRDRRHRTLWLAEDPADVKRVPNRLQVCRYDPSEPHRTPVPEPNDPTAGLLARLRIRGFVACLRSRCSDAAVAAPATVGSRPLRDKKPGQRSWRLTPRNTKAPLFAGLS